MCGDDNGAVVYGTQKRDPLIGELPTILVPGGSWDLGSGLAKRPYSYLEAVGLCKTSWIAPISPLFGCLYGWLSKLWSLFGSLLYYGT